MDYIGNIEYWDTKFKSRGKTHLSPEKELVKNIELLSQGSVLDLACGDGRNSLFLLEKGFETTGIDFSLEALNRLKHFAHINSFEVSTAQIDLTIENSLDVIGCFDNVIINHYRLPKHQMQSVSKKINSGGILFLTGFGYKHKTDEKITENDLILESDMKYLSKDMKQIYRNEYQDERGYFVTYIYKKK